MTKITTESQLCDERSRAVIAIEIFYGGSLFARKRYGLDTVAVEIADKCRVIFHALMRTQTRRAIRRTTRLQRRFVERIDLSGRFGAKTGMATAIGRDERHIAAKVDPELRIDFSET